MTSAQANSKDVSKQLEYVKQQEQLRALGNLRNTAKPLSADSMIEDLLSKKETFQKRSPEPQQKQEVMGWLSGTIPPLYSQVWASVQSSNGLADTPSLSTLLMSSGLPTDTLAYIWSLANRTVPGALTQQEVYLMLALVGLTQSGYHITNLATVVQLPQAPMPTLDLALLPQRQYVYPNPLNVTTLPEPQTYNWITPETQQPNISEKIGISYVSSGPMVSPKLLTDNSVNFGFSEFTLKSSVEGSNSISSNHSSLNAGLGTKNTHSKHFGSTYTFSFPSLNESPSHIAGAKSEETDPFDDEFTDFQSADFTSVSNTAPTTRQANPAIDDDEEFTNFQKAPPKIEDDLSVLVIDGTNIPSAQTLWVADSPGTTNQKEKVDTKGIRNTGMFRNMSDFMETPQPSSPMKPDGIEHKDHRDTKYDVFQEIDDDRFSVFHNPLPDDEDKHSVISGNTNENVHLETKSIFNHSLFSDPDSSLNFFKTDPQAASLDFPKLKAETNKIADIAKGTDEDDDEFSNFQNFPVSFPESSTGPVDSTDKYDVFRTIVFQDNIELDSGHVMKVDEPKHENTPQVQSFDEEMDLFHNVGRNEKDKESDLFGNFMEKNAGEIKFGDFQEAAVLPAKGNSSNIDHLFSSLAISEKTSEKDTKDNSTTGIDVVEDKYKALRLLEENSAEVDEFGEFLGADVPNFGNQPPKMAEKPSIQIRCLEACLNLLKDGLSTLSRASSQEVVSEVLSDPRASTYLDCLLEVHRVSERIISNMENDSCTTIKAELRQVWDGLAPYFTHTEHIHLAETVGALCGVCRSNTGPSPVTFGAMTFHSPCANLYLHCVEPVLPNINTTPIVSS